MWHLRELCDEDRPIDWDRFWSTEDTEGGTEVTEQGTEDTEMMGFVSLCDL